MGRKFAVFLLLAVAAGVVTLLAIRPAHDRASTGRRPTPGRAATPGAVGTADCGVFVREATSGGISAEGWNCFTRAMSGGVPARLRLTAFTTEGDPEFVTYTTVGNGAATVLTDLRLDAFRGRALRLRTEVCRRPDPRPVARGSFLDCAAPMPLSSGGRVAPIAEVLCEFASHWHVIGARMTTLAAVRAYSPGGPSPGLHPGRDFAPSRAGGTQAAWCWTDSARVSGSPGPRWTLYAVLATGESVSFLSTDAGRTPPTAFPAVR